VTPRRHRDGHLPGIAHRHLVRRWCGRRHGPCLRFRKYQRPGQPACGWFRHLHRQRDDFRLRDGNAQQHRDQSLRRWRDRSESGNNSATDSDTLAPQRISPSPKPTASPTRFPAASVTYTITCPNAGPSDAPGATVADTFRGSFPARLGLPSAQAAAPQTAAGSGDINDTVTSRPAARSPIP
jgi:hypothetical protein